MTIRLTQKHSDKEAARDIDTYGYPRAKGDTCVIEIQKDHRVAGAMHGKVVGMSPSGKTVKVEITEVVTETTGRGYRVGKTVTFANEGFYDAECEHYEDDLRDNIGLAEYGKKQDRYSSYLPKLYAQFTNEFAQEVLDEAVESADEIRILGVKRAMESNNVRRFQNNPRVQELINELYEYLC